MEKQDASARCEDVLREIIWRWEERALPVVDALKRQIRLPVEEHAEGCDRYVCPTCGQKFLESQQKFCDQCGQALRWDVEEEEE